MIKLVDVDNMKHGDLIEYIDLYANELAVFSEEEPVEIIEEVLGKGRKATRCDASETENLKIILKKIVERLTIERSR